ncbi:hypothetical protein [Streptacidiphilus cavernicola]|uniref:PKD domain-containing protein n=1 Tax=Streptacidiphilus cavernicola TaxID=3342716 RepID=A0ABV6VY92_9ACTN
MTVTGGDRIRITQLDGCGRPVYGPCSAVVTDGIVNLTLSPEVDDGDAKESKNFSGGYCYSQPACPTIKYWNTTIEWCEVNFAAFKFINPSYEIVYDEDGIPIGYYSSNTIDCSRGYALEIWLQLAGSSDACKGEEAEGLWGYMVVPWITGGAPDDIKLGGTDAITWTTKGTSKNSGGWNKGPYEVLRDKDGNPVALPQKFKDDQPWAMFQTTVAPPEIDCDCVEVDRPVPDPADLVVEGVSGEDPRVTVQLKPDNHGMGTTTVDWGDHSAPEDVSDLSKALHKYAANGTYTVKVCDKQDPDVCTTKAIKVPLDPDAPVLTLTCSQDKPLTAVADVKLPEHAGKQALITWGDGTPDQVAEVGDDSTIKATHLYKRNGRYTVTVRRAETKTYKDRRTITLPCTDSETKKPTLAAVKGVETDESVTYALNVTGADGQGTITIDSTGYPVTVAGGVGTIDHPFAKGEAERTEPVTFTDQTGKSADPVNVTVPAKPAAKAKASTAKD